MLQVWQEGLAIAEIHGEDMQQMQRTGAHAAHVCPMSKEQAVLAATDEVGARHDGGDNGTVKVSPQLSSPKRQAGYSRDGLGRMGDGVLARQVGNEAWVCNSGTSTHMMPSADHISNYWTNSETYYCPSLTLILAPSKDTVASIFSFGSETVFGKYCWLTLQKMLDLLYHLLSLLTLVKDGRTFEGRPPHGSCN